MIIAIAALLVIAVATIGILRTQLEDRRRLEILAERLATENRIEHMTRATLHAMRDVAQHRS